MIVKLPPRSEEAFRFFRQELADIMTSLKARRPLSLVMAAKMIEDVVELIPDLESEIMQDMAELHELAARWELDDVVLLVEQHAKGGAR